MTQEADTSVLSLRPYNQDDIPFIQSSWGSSYYKGANYIKHMSPKDFHFFHRPIREAFFNRPETTAIVCSPSIDPYLIMGWIAVEKLHDHRGIILHYLYVKEAFKQQGIADHLINGVLKDKDPILCTHRTEKADRIMSRNKDKYRRFQDTPNLVKGMS